MCSTLCRVFVIALFLVGCNAKGPKFTQVEPLAEAEARVYFYRLSGMLDGAAAPMVQVDGVDSFRIKNGGYHIFDVLPGSRTIAVKAGGKMSGWRAGELQVVVEAEAGKTYFVRLLAEANNASQTSGFPSISGNYSLDVVDEQTALAELLTTKRSNK